jgi:hypothetical protein
MFDSRVAKNGHCGTWPAAGPGRRRAGVQIQADGAAETVPARQQQAALAPREPGMARRSSMRLVDLREAGREPMFSSAISAIGVAAKK